MSSDRGVVFVVSDDPSDARELREILEGDRYSVTVVDDGAKAVATIAAAQPNLVLLDADLDGTDPFRLLAALREGDQVRDIPCHLRGHPGNDSCSCGE